MNAAPESAFALGAASRAALAGRLEPVDTDRLAPVPGRLVPSRTDELRPARIVDGDGPACSSRSPFRARSIGFRSLHGLRARRTAATNRPSLSRMTLTSNTIALDRAHFQHDRRGKRRLRFARSVVIGARSAQIASPDPAIATRSAIPRDGLAFIANADSR